MKPNALASGKSLQSLGPAVVNDALVDRLAEVSDTDRRSVIRRLAGLKVKGRAGRRIDAAIAAAMKSTQGTRAA
jgi:hypothetical protein